MSEENTISNIKINGTAYAINDPSKANAEDIKIINEITQTNNELLNNAHSKLDDLLNRIENKNLTFFKCVSVKDTSTINSEEVKDLFVTFAIAGSPYEGVFKHQGTYNNYDYWKHESVECYVLCFGPVGEVAPNVYQWLISEKLSTGDEPLYCGASSAEANTPLSVSTWTSVKGTAYGLPIVTKSSTGRDDEETGDDGDSGEIMLVVSGLESVLGEGTVNTSNGTWMNGEYYLVDKTATGTARIWKHKDYESVIKIAGSPIQYWAICPTNTSTNFEIFISDNTSSNVPTDSPYDENTLGSLVWNFRGSTASSVSVVAEVVSGNSGDSDNGSGDDSSGSIDSYVVSNCGTVVARGTYVYTGEHNNKPYYTYTNPNNSVTYYLSYRSDTSGWGITVALTGSVTPLYYQSTVSETPDDGVYGVATGISPAPTIVKGSSSSDSGSGSDTSYAFSISGLTTPAGANGNYIKQSTGVYKHETNEYYVSRDTLASYWCLSPIANPLNPTYANFSASNSSSITNPWDATEWAANLANPDPYRGAGTLVITKAGSDSGDTPSENEIISYVVSGAGSPEYDGTYTYLDEYNGYPRYSCLGVDGSTMMYLYYSPAVAGYIINAMGNVAYMCYGTDITGTWSTNMGNSPAPVVTKGSAGDDNNGTSTITGYSVIGAGTTAANGVYTLIDNTENNEKWSNGTYNLSKMYTNVLGEATTYYIYPISAGLLPSAANHTYYGYKSGGNYKANEVTWSIGTGSMAGIAPIPSFTPIYDDGGDSNGDDSGSDSNGTVTTHGTWSGFKAILKYDSNNKKYYDFESVLTENLSYGDGFVPEVGGIYDENALIKIELYS